MLGFGNVFRAFQMASSNQVRLLIYVCMYICVLKNLITVYLRTPTGGSASIFVY